MTYFTTQCRYRMSSTLCNTPDEVGVQRLISSFFNCNDYYLFLMCNKKFGTNKSYIKPLVRKHKNI